MNAIDLAGAWAQLAIAEHAELVISQRPSSPLECEIIGETAADWYLVKTIPGDEDRALRWLSSPGRRFGAFKPEQRRRNAAGVPLAGAGLEPMFPGWLFVYTWDIAHNRSRILACPGVIGIVCFPNTNLPVAVDRHVHERLDRKGHAVRSALSFIDALRAIHESERELAGLRSHGGHYAVQGRRQAKRLSKRGRKELHRLTDEAKSRGIYSDAERQSIADLAPHERISLLMRALAAPSKVTLSSGVGG